MEAALEWGLCPDEWRQKSIDDRARMLAHGWIKATREAYAAEGRLFEAERGKDEKPNAAGGMRQFDQLRQMMKPPPGWQPKPGS